MAEASGDDMIDQGNSGRPRVCVAGTALELVSDTTSTHKNTTNYTVIPCYIY